MKFTAILFTLSLTFILGCAGARSKPTLPPHPSEATHPLDPLTAEEITSAVKLIRSSDQFPKNGVFPVLSLREPSKQEVHAWNQGPFRREAIAVVLDPERNLTYEAVTDLRAGKILSWKLIRHVQPLVLTGEYDSYPKIVKADPRFQAALKRRGISNADDVVIEGWAAGQFLPKGQGEDRLMRGICYLKGDGANYYGSPIEGLIPTVNMTQGKLVELIDIDSRSVPGKSQQLDAKSIGAQREGPRPLVVSQPEGPSFEVKGHEVKWQRWKFHFGMHPREGLVLSDVSYEDGGKARPILYRASLSETVVPYGDPSRTWAWRSAFDEGEYGIGKFSVPLDQDAPANATLFDAVFADDSGNAYVAKNRVALFEKDGGVLWRHTQPGGEISDVRRSRELVLLFVSTIGNYDYSFSWIFRQDGSIIADAGATGIMLPKGAPELAASPAHSHAFGHRVDRAIVAPHHQHFFNYRIDFDVDGERNSVSELETTSAPAGKDNPHGNVALLRERELKTEKQAQRDMEPSTGRKWKIYNPSVITALGYHPGYLLVPEENGSPFVLKGSDVRKRAGFIDHAFWATRYQPDEMHAAGDYPNQSRGGDGLPRWTKRDGSIDNQDLVVWYTFGLTHVPRPEEWPVMPLTHIGFKLLPAGFFDRNPGLDVRN